MLRYRVHDIPQFGAVQLARCGKAASFPTAASAESHPLLSQIRRLREILFMLGEPLPGHVQKELDAIEHEANGVNLLQRVQRALDPYCVAAVQLPRGKPTRAFANPNGLPCSNRDGARS